MNRKIKRTAQIFCNNINSFTLSFYKLNVSFLNESINLFLKKNLTDLKLLNNILYIQKLLLETYIVVTHKIWYMITQKQMYLIMNRNS